MKTKRRFLLTALVSVVCGLWLGTQAPAVATPGYASWTDLGIVYSGPSGDAYYPSVIYDANGFGGGSPLYKMWYSDGFGAAFVVTSGDGLSWGGPSSLNGLGGDAHHVQVVYDENCFGPVPCDTAASKYKMWYWDTDAQLYSISAMATAESADGITWANDTTLTQSETSPLVTGGGTGWNRGSYGPIDVFYQAGASNTGTEPWDYSYVMYYDGTDGSHEFTGLAYSSDGLDWTAYSADPVLNGSTAAAWDCSDSAYGTVYHDASGYHFWYSGGGGDDGSGGCQDHPVHEGIGYASSSDSKTWAKDSGNPIFHISDGVSHRDSRVYTPAVVDNGSGLLRMYYSALASGGPKEIGLAVNAEPPTTTFVDDDWVGLAPLTQVYFPGDPNPHYIGLDALATVQDGIDSVVGSTVNVAAGTYNEQVVIDTANLTLNGPNAGADPGCSGTRPNAEATIAWSTLTSVGTASTVVIAANGVTVDGFTIQNTNGTQNQVSVLIGGHYVGDTHPSDGSNVRNNIISSGYNNVYVWQSSDSTIERNRVLASVETQISIRDNASQGTRDALRNSVLDNCIDKAGVASLGHSVAIGVTGGGAQDFTGTLIQGNTMKNSGTGTGHFRGIDANLANGSIAEPVRVYGNTITDTSEQGIRIESSNNYDIGGSSSSTGNIITGSRGAVGNGRRGITTAGTSTGLAIQYNTISGHSSTSGNDAEIVVTTAGNTILHNTLYVADSSPAGVGGLGLRLDNPSNVFGENTFQGDGQRMLQASGASGPALTVIDVTASTFKTAGGVTLDPNSQADLVRIEDRLRHHMDVPSNLVLLIFKTDTTVATALNNATTPGAIQRAVNAVPGSTVIVGPGTYNETVRLDSTKVPNISLIGDGKTTTFLTGGIRFEGNYDGLSVENFTITGDGRQRPGLAQATVGTSAAAVLVSNARFVNNVFDGEGITGVEGGRFGIYISSLGGSFTFENNEMKGYRGWGTLELNDTAHTVSSYAFTDNNIHDNSGSSALRGSPSDRTATVTATGNAFDNNGGGDSWASLEINEAETVTVSDNSITNTQAGSWGEGEALQFWHITSLTVTDNTIEDNYQGIYFPGGAWSSDLSGVEIHSNSISGNTQFGFQADAGNTGTADAEDNWWGSANGPTHASNTFNVGAQGDVVSDKVDFVPWLDGPPPGGDSFAPVTTTDPVGDHASIQAGVNASNPGGSVNAKTGIFTEKVTLNKGVIVQAASSPVVDCGGPGNGFTLSANNVTISGFEIRNCSNGIQGQTSNSTISNNIIHDHLNHVGSNGVGISLWGDNDNNQILGNTVYNNDRQGIFIGHCDFAGPGGACTAGGTHISSGNVISSNVIHDNGRYTQPNGPDASQYGIQLWNGDGNEVKLNEVYNHKGSGFGVGVYLCSADSNDVHDNNVHDSQYNVAAYGCGGSSTGNNIHLNTLSAPTDSNIRLFGGSPSNTVNDNTMSGGVYGVRVSPGNTDTAVTANDILGFKQNGVRIDGSADVDVSANNIDGQGACNSSYTEGTSPETDTRCYGVEWIDSTGTISGNTITGVKIGTGTGAQTGVGIRASARSGKATTVTIDHNVLSDYQKNGMVITGQYSGTVSATVETNTVTGWGPTSVIAQNGVQVSSGASATVSGNNNISGHDYTPSSWAAAGVLVQNATATIQGNDIHDNMEGAYLDGATIPEFSGNTVTDTRDTGVYLLLTDDGKVSGNTITASAYGLWIADSNRATVSYNTISDNDQGIVIDGTSSNASIYGNDVLNNSGSSTSGIHVECYFGTCPSGIEIHYNNIVGNSPSPGAYGLYNDTTNVVGATYNWWGACSGPYHPTLNSLGAGDAVSDYVDFTPWVGGACDADGDGLTNDQETLIYFTDPNDPDTDHDGFFDGPVDVDGPGPGQPNDNCPAVANLGQENADNQIGNGTGIPGHDGTVPNSAGDNVGDACDSPDADNDGIPNTSDSNPGGDITYDDNINGSMCPADGADDGPSWDSNCDGRRDGWVGACGSTSADADGDGLKNAWETCKWGTSPAIINTDGDLKGDCVEAADVDGNTAVNLNDVVAYAKAALLAPAAFGRDGDFDIDGNNQVNLNDVVQEAKFGLLAGLCK